MMIIVWGVVFVLMTLAELATAGLATIWFAVGSLVALVLAIFDVKIIWQIAAFVVVSLLLLILTRPIVKKLLPKKKGGINADRVIGRKGVAGEEINGIDASGSVKIDGIIWSAKAKNEDEVIPAGTMVTVDSLEGSKVIVTRTEHIEEKKE